MKTKKIYYQCGACGYCLDTCCVYAATSLESLSPRGKLLLLRKFEEGVIDDPYALTSRLYACTLCEACQNACPSKTGITEAIKNWRNTNHLNQEMWNSTIKSVIEKNNPYQKQQNERNQWNSTENKDSSIAYFPGCTTSLMEPQIAINFVNFMQDRLHFQVIDDLCCGSILSKGGFQKESQKVVEQNINYFKENGVETLITSCAGCYSFFLEYPFNIKVLHTVQVLSDYVDELTPSSLSTTFHDPCHLLRNSLTSQPRYILKTLTQYTEKKTQSCCGAGGGMILNYNELADNICKSLFDTSNIDTMITACPFCLHHIKKNNPDKKIISIEELVAVCEK